MGLLSNPHTRSKFTSIVQTNSSLLSIGLLLGGALWLTALVHPNYNGGTYFSENSLLPGLVRPSFNSKNDLDKFYKEYNEQLQISGKKSGSDVPIQWLEEKLISLGLEVHTHGYKFTYPMNLLNNQTATGKNIYAVLRAPRAASTESMVLTTPLRPVESGLTGTAGSVSLMLSLAKHMKKYSYWSKDIIFLFAQHEYVGLQAWLDGYLGVSASTHIQPGRLPSRAGVIQGAVNLEFPDLTFDSINVNIDGINAQLPNLDLVNLVNKLCRDEGITSKLHGREDLRRGDAAALVKYNAITTFKMISQLATGMANGNHGLFLRYRIEAVTLEGLPGMSGGGRHQLRVAAQIIESVFRSINNLMEKFHQSFFFYLMPCTYRYISIGLYMPPLSMMIGSILIQAISLWCRFTEAVETRDAKVKANKDNAFDSSGRLTSETVQLLRLPDNVMQGLAHLLPLIIACHLAGLLVYRAPNLFGSGEIKTLPAADAVILGAGACIISTMILATTVIRKEEFEEMNWMLFKCLSLIYHGLVLFSLALLNVSLAIIISVFTLPVYCILQPRQSRVGTVLQAVLCLVVSPVGIFTIMKLLILYLNQGTLGLDSGLVSFINEMNEHLVYGLIDHLVFGNYLYSVLCLFIFPNWLMLWAVVWMNV